MATQTAESSSRVRYAVVGMGHIAKKAVLPAFANASNAQLTALISGDRAKVDSLASQYGVDGFIYDQYDECLRSGKVDAVYIATSNDTHLEYAVRAARAGVHVLCEKPLAVTESECREMISACAAGNVKLMVAYRLQFEPANLAAMDVARSGVLGDLRFFECLFSMQVAKGNARTKASAGGGSVYDIGIYAINAARYIFGEEPSEVLAALTSGTDERSLEVDEMTSAILRFPDGKLATFTSSFNGPSLGSYTVAGTKGSLRLDPAFAYAKDLQHQLSVGDQTTTTVFPAHDHFAPQLDYFAQCIQEDKNPGPDGWEGLIDVQIIEAIYKSAETGTPVKLPAFDHSRYQK